jgi:hypothetical protein
MESGVWSLESGASDSGTPCSHAIDYYRLEDGESDLLTPDSRLPTDV